MPALATPLGFVMFTLALFACSAPKNSAATTSTKSGGTTASSALKISGGFVVLAGTKTFTASGGTSPYSYSVIGGGAGGTIVASTGLYTAPGSSGTDTIQATDSVGNTARATVYVAAALSLSSISLVKSASKSFAASGGVLPYSYAVQAGGVGGSISSTTGLYFAPASAGSATIVVTDAVGNTATATATVTNALALSNYEVTINGTKTLAASGGSGSYTYSLKTSGAGGSIVPSTGVYSAPASTGVDTIQVTDSASNTATGTVTVVALSLSLSSKSLVKSLTTTFTASGGTGSYTYSVESGGVGGTINASTGLYTAPATAGTATILVTDSLGNTATATATVTNALSLANASVMESTSLTLAAAGGTSPYTYAVTSALGGTIAGGTSVYAAPAATGSETVRVTDANGNTATATITVTATIALSGESVVVGNTTTFTATGGVSPYTYSVNSGGAGGTVNSSSGVYVAPSSVGSGSDTVKVTDSLGNTVTATATISATLSLTASSSTVLFGGTVTLTAAGGVTAYTYSIVSGSGTLSGSTYSAPTTGTAGTVVLKVTDSESPAATATVTLTTKAVTQWIGAGGLHACRISGAISGQLECWGDNAYGQLGDGTTTNQTSAEEIDVGNLYTAVTAGGDHTCAIQENGNLLCWGDNASGQLGVNSTDAYRAGPNLVNDTTTYSYVSAGSKSTCGITTAGVLKCWGDDTKSQLGDGLTANQSSPEVIDSGTAYAKVSVGWQHACGITTAGVLKCWGYNNQGQVGNGSTSNAITPTVINSGVSYLSVSAGYEHTCAVTTAGVLKCWGLDTSGQIGDGATSGNYTIPHVVGATVYAGVVVSANTSCGLLSSGAVNCFGDNALGEVGDSTTGGTVTTPTAATAPAGTVFTYVSGGSFEDPSASGGAFFCGFGTNGTAQVYDCWGDNSDEQVDPGSATASYDSPTNIPD